MKNLGNRRSRTGTIINDRVVAKRFMLHPERRYPVQLKDDIGYLDRSNVHVIWIDDRNAIDDYLEKVKGVHALTSRILQDDTWCSLEDFTNVVVAQMMAYSLLCYIIPDKEYLRETMEKYHGRPISDEEVTSVLDKYSDGSHEDLYAEQEAGGMLDITNEIWCRLTDGVEDDDDEAYEQFDYIYNNILETTVYNDRMADVIAESIYGSGVDMAFVYDGELNPEPFYCYTNLADGYFTLRLRYEIVDRRIH